MGFRTLEISQAAELHIKDGQLEITSADGVALIPIEDLNQIMVHGANIRLSTMDLSVLSQNNLNDPPKMVYRSTIRMQIMIRQVSARLLSSIQSMRTK